MKVGIWYINSYEDIFQIPSPQTDSSNFSYVHRYAKGEIARDERGNASNRQWSEDSREATDEEVRKYIPSYIGKSYEIY